MKFGCTFCTCFQLTNFEKEAIFLLIYVQKIIAGMLVPGTIDYILAQQRIQLHNLPASDLNRS